MRYLSSGYDGGEWTVATIAAILIPKVSGDDFGLVVKAPNNVTPFMPAWAGVCGTECGVESMLEARVRNAETGVGESRENNYEKFFAR
jgi:hypothetical protein